MNKLLFSNINYSFWTIYTGCIIKSSSIELDVFEFYTGAYLWFLQTLSAIFLSFYASFSSSIIKIKSKRESNESGIPIFFVGGRSLWYYPYIGFAAAITEQRAFNEQWIPAFAIVTVCCSIT